jgi:hypothetical protein
MISRLIRILHRFRLLIGTFASMSQSTARLPISRQQKQISLQPFFQRYDAADTFGESRRQTLLKQPLTTALTKARTPESQQTASHRHHFRNGDLVFHSNKELTDFTQRKSVFD